MQVIAFLPGSLLYGASSHTPKLRSQSDLLWEMHRIRSLLD